jgi:hypothetical protein
MTVRNLVHGSNDPDAFADGVDTDREPFYGFIFFEDQTGMEPRSPKTVVAGGYLFGVDVDEASIANSVSRHDIPASLIDEAVHELDVDRATAARLIAQDTDIWNLGEDAIDRFAGDIWFMDDGEADWWVQHMTGRAARALGYIGVKMRDETGTSIMLYGPDIEGQIGRVDSDDA